MLRSVIANLASDRLLAVHILHGGINERNQLDLMRSLRRDRVSLQRHSERPRLIQRVRLQADFARDATLGSSPLSANSGHTNSRASVGRGLFILDRVAIFSTGLRSSRQDASHPVTGLLARLLTARD
jgi:hypothetical protein